MSQPVSSYKPIRFQSPGTTVVSGVPITIHNLVRAAILAGTVDMYDSATAAGTAASNLILSLGTATTMEAGGLQVKTLDWETRKGLTIVASGTLDYYVSVG